MQKSRITIIILAASISLIGLTITQSSWVWNAVKLVQEQHDHRVDMALKEVIDGMVNATEAQRETAASSPLHAFDFNGDRASDTPVSKRTAA